MTAGPEVRETGDWHGRMRDLERPATSLCSSKAQESFLMEKYGSLVVDAATLVLMQSVALLNCLHWLEIIRGINNRRTTPAIEIIQCKDD